jgi:hypothetical protein
MKTKAIILLAIFALFMQELLAQVCGNPTTTIYALNQAVGYIYPVNVNTATVGTSLVDTATAISYPGNTPNANAIGLDIQNSTFYFFQNNTAGTQKFVSYNTLTKKYTILATPTIISAVVKGCVTADGTGYYCIDGGNNLLFYNISSNTWTTIGSNLKNQNGNSLTTTFSNLGSGDMAIDGIGRLWIIVSSSSKYGLYVLGTPLPNTPTSPITLTELVPPTTATPSGSVFAGIAFSSTGTIYMSTVNDLYVLQNNLSLTHIGAFSIPGVGGDLTSCNFPFGILQISWADFSAFLQNNHSVLLTWSINQQIDNAGFTIERSRDGETWENIGYQANGPGGNTLTYSFPDNSPNSGVNYYRIKATDINGTSSYSVIKTVNIAGNNSVNIWPIPAKGTIKIQVEVIANGSASSNFRIISLSGQLVSSGLINTGSNTVDVSSLSPGTYIVEVKLPNGETLYQKLLKW